MFWLKSLFYPILLGLAIYIISNANRKVPISVKTSYEPNRYDNWLTQYRILKNSASFG